MRLARLPVCTLCAAFALAISSQELRVARAHLTSPTASDAPHWAGAVLNAPAHTWQSITASFTVPALRAPAEGDNARYAASLWVGLDGDTCTRASLRSGVDMVISAGGASSYHAWWEWQPAARGSFDDFDVAPGDTITANVVADNVTGTSGTVILTNLRSGQSATRALLGTVPLCGRDAAWAVVEVVEVGRAEPLADFRSVTFTNAAAFGGMGIVGPENAKLVEIEQHGRVLTDVTVESGSVEVSYIGS
ncbi:peptidase G1 family domain-containing protein [Phanerochaete sordida]|uniref:Peptidase G1 family domain-containing protein n=1 Tax=Phanerochaete sordida TaxID=48140 RepID=A0A9P3GNR4_9APHY|nr:peptidase G1 family domain-containing protein [Phanerochaete sordida]